MQKGEKEAVLFGGVWAWVCIPGSRAAVDMVSADNELTDPGVKRESKAMI